MKYRYLIFYLIAFILFNTKCLADDSDKIFGSMTYMIGNKYCAEKAPLVDGKYEVPRIMYVYYEGQYAYGDFNSDGLKDAAVIIAESGGGSGYFIELAFLINEDGKFVHKKSEYIGDRVIINSIGEDKGKVIIDMLVRDEKTWAVGVMKQVKREYEYSGPIAWGPDYQTLINRK